MLEDEKSEAIIISLSDTTKEEFYKKESSGRTYGTINVWRDPYENGYSTTRAKKIMFQPGLTVLTGCNGSGKTTLMHNIKEECKNNNVICMFYDNLSDGGLSHAGGMLDGGNISGFASLWSASEGERIGINFVNTVLKFVKNSKEKFPEAEEMWLLLDAIDSGLSVDGVAEIRNVIEHVIKDIPDKKVYIIASANEYELARNADCIDIISGKHITFSDYEEYRSFILKSREKKDARIEKANQKNT